MRVSRIQLEKFMVKIARTREEEASCDDCAQLSAQLVEVLLRGDAPNEELLSILQHLEQCVPCSEEFLVLKDCVRMELEQNWPTLDEMWNKLDQRSAPPP
ncbi:MAG TPA: hypothetical protein VFD70_02695 [Anaerolineae bacterium]|nr:hypothetical protein [Anaerolineae bacterium]